MPERKETLAAEVASSDASIVDTVTNDHAESTSESAADPVLVAAVDVARAALMEITPPETIGEPVGHVAEGKRVVSLFFASALPGYPGWHWTVTISRVDADAEPSVLETELMPGEHALLAPDWVPWSKRLAQYRATAVAPSLEQSEDESTDDEGNDDLDEFDTDDLDDNDLDDVDLGEEDDENSDEEFDGEGTKTSISLRVNDQFPGDEE